MILMGEKKKFAITTHLRSRLREQEPEEPEEEVRAEAELPEPEVRVRRELPFQKDLWSSYREGHHSRGPALVWS